MRYAHEPLFLLAIVVAVFAIAAGPVRAWEDHGGHGYTSYTYYDDYGGYDHAYHGDRYGYVPYNDEHAGHRVYYSDYGGYGRDYGYTYAEQCTRYVRIYDDAGGWVWGRRIAC